MFRLKGKRLLALILVSVLALVFTVGCQKQSAAPEGTPGETPKDTGWPKRIAIGAASPGGGFYMGGSAAATIINNYVDGVDAVVEITGASRHNAELLQAGEIHLGLVATEVLWEAYHGKFSFEGNPHDKIRAMIPGWPGVYIWVTLADKGIENVTDFDGKTFSSGPVGSGTEIVANYIFECFDIKPKVTNLPTSDAARSLGDGTIDGYSLGHPAPSVTELEATHEVRIVTMNEEQKKIFQEKYPQYVWLDIPPGYYKCTPDGAHNVGLYNMICVRADLPEDFVYELTKAMYENIGDISRAWAQMGEGMALENIGYATAPYHPGAYRYFKEQGIDVPGELIPPEMR